jgi:hypothetical protein
VKSKSDSVSSIRILGACHLLEKTVVDVLYDMHLPALNSVEVFKNIVFTVRSKSETVSSIGILGACHLPEKTLIDVDYYMHLPPLNSVEDLGCSVRFCEDCVHY